MQADAEGKASVKSWMGRVGERTRPKYLYHFDRFMAWLKENGQEFQGYTPDQLIEFQLDASSRDQFRILDLIQEFVLTYKGRSGYKRRAYAVIRSFFLHNRASLPSDKSFKLRGDLAKTQGSLHPSDMRDVVLSSNPTYQAIFLCMAQGALDGAAFEYWNLNGLSRLEEALVRGSDVIRIDQPGRKEELNEIPFYKLIGGDALDYLKKYMDQRPAEGSAIFIGNKGEPVSKWAVYMYWTRHLRKLGLIPEPRVQEIGLATHGKNPHEIRDVFRSLWTKSPAKYELGEFFMGHIIDPNLYDKAYNDEAWARSEYRKALPWLNIMSSPIPHGQADGSEVERLTRENAELRLKVQELQNNGDNRIDSLRREFMAKLEELRPQVIESIRKIDRLEGER